MSNQPEHQELIKELVDGVSTQARLANRTWLALMTVALLAVLPHVPTKDGKLSLPFNLGEVDPIWFHGVVFCILVVFAIAFASAHAQQMRAQDLAQLEIGSLARQQFPLKHTHPRELYDMVRIPSFNRIAPLAQLLRGKYQYYKTGHNCPEWLRLVSVTYYALLKLTALIVYFSLPFWAVWRAYANLATSAFFLRVAFLTGGLLAELTMLHVMLTEFSHAGGILKHLWRLPDQS